MNGNDIFKCTGSEDPLVQSISSCEGDLHLTGFHPIVLLSAIVVKN